MPRSRPALPRTRVPWLVACALPAALGTFAIAESEASAAVRGRQGIEIEGAQDRRGFYIGGGLGFGGTFFYVDDFIPATRMELNLGGGVGKRFTLGTSLHLMPYLRRDSGVAFGGDIEATGYMWKGLYARGGLGFAGVPRDDGEENGRSLSMGLGGKAEAGYEFWLSASAAMGVGVIYDARFVPGSTFPRQTLLIGLRVTRF